jgi:hypothetical protein
MRGERVSVPAARGRRFGPGYSTRAS